MKIQELEKLLEKYYNGEASLEEENRIAAFFKQNEVPEPFLADKALFDWRLGTKVESIKEEQFEDDILVAIERSEQKDRGSSTAFRNQLYWLAGIAATLLIIMGTYFGFIRDRYMDTYDNPELAYLETKKVLYYVSSAMNKGTEPVSNSMKKYQRGAGEIKKLNELNKGISEIKNVTQLPGEVNALKYFNLLQDPGLMISQYTMK